MFVFLITERHINETYFKLNMQLVLQLIQKYFKYHEEGKANHRNYFTEFYMMFGLALSYLKIIHGINISVDFQRINQLNRIINYDCWVTAYNRSSNPEIIKQTYFKESEKYIQELKTIMQSHKEVISLAFEKLGGSGYLQNDEEFSDFFGEGCFAILSSRFPN